MNFESMILPAPEGIGMNISCILTHWLLLEVTWRAGDPMFSAEDYGLGHTGVDFCYVEAALVADPNCYLHWMAPSKREGIRELEQSRAWARDMTHSYGPLEQWTK